jgi:quercetin dioxygenase-like cupin family protein
MMDELTIGMIVNWDDMPWETVRPGIDRAGLSTEHVMCVMNRIEVGNERRPHSHADFTQIALVISGNGLFQMGDIDHEVGPGTVLIIPAGTEHSILNNGTEPIYNLDIFGPPRSDYAHLTSWMKDHGVRGSRR